MVPNRNTTHSCSTEQTTEANIAPQESEIEAVLYIVVTLLFYSLGIIIGIILYLKREKQEIEEDKVYDEFLSYAEDPYTALRYARVQQVVARLNYLEQQKKRRERVSADKKLSIMDDRRANCENVTKVKDLNEDSKKVGYPPKMCDQDCDFVDEGEETGDYNVFEQDGESITAVVAKLIDPEKDKYLLEDSIEDNVKVGIPTSSSLQSIKDYEEEPRRSERSSVSSASEENVSGEEKTRLMSENDSVFEDATEQKQKKIKGCIVTNV
ncbi:uncharacterized protein LOC134267004 [Saccostrea cucullata]|uniref:uncharacterized protein LOC134267004 n=1 Tax=Saccostrea cuccullata TaxID=36930 RepID=UPI002ED32F9A